MIYVCLYLYVYMFLSTILIQTSPEIILCMSPHFIWENTTSQLCLEKANNFITDYYTVKAALIEVTILSVRNAFHLEYIYCQSRMRNSLYYIRLSLH